MRTSIALAAGFGLALAAVSAAAQNPSYENRGYGGPLYVGPNFEKGGQHTPPDYGSKPSKKAMIKREVTKPRKAPQKPEKEEVATQKEVPAPAAEKETTPAKPETSSTTSPATETAASSGAATCKKFEPTTGQTITVPCQ